MTAWGVRVTGVAAGNTEARVAEAARAARARGVSELAGRSGTAAAHVPVPAVALGQGSAGDGQQTADEAASGQALAGDEVATEAGGGAPASSF